MIRHLISTVVSLSIFVASTISMTAQGRPSFAGKWLVVGQSVYTRDVRPGVPVSFESSLLRECVAVQTDKGLVFKGSDDAVLVSIAWDGSERRGPIKGEKGRELVWKAQMDGNTVVIDTRVDPARNNPPEANVRQVLSLDSAGQLILEYRQVPGWPVLKFVYQRTATK